MGRSSDLSCLNAFPYAGSAQWQNRMFKLQRTHSSGHCGRISRPSLFTYPPKAGWKTHAGANVENKTCRRSILIYGVAYGILKSLFKKSLWTLCKPSCSSWLKENNHKGRKENFVKNRLQPLKILKALREGRHFSSGEMSEQVRKWTAHPKTTTE